MAPRTAKPAYFFPTPGTWGWRERTDPRAWFNASSDFFAVMAEEGLQPLRERPYWWTTRLQGHEFWRRLFGWLLPVEVERRDLQDWFVGAVGYSDYIAAAPFRKRRSRRVAIGHSHGGNVLAIGVAEGAEVDVMVTVGMPVREELYDLYRVAATRVDTWIVLHASDGDDTQRRGSYGDGHVGVVRVPPSIRDLPNVRVIAVPGADHSRLLREPRDPNMRKVWQYVGPVLRGDG